VESRKAAVKKWDEVGAVLERESAGSLSNQCGIYLHFVKEDYLRVQQCLEQRLKFAEEVYGTEHIKIAACLNNLGMLRFGMNDFVAARQLLERALHIVEKHFGENHPEVAMSLNTLGLTLHDMGELEAAERTLLRALTIYWRVLPPQHPDIRDTIGGLERIKQTRDNL
jgi:tetratricopeptide (TPR) repeat protein